MYYLEKGKRQRFISRESLLLKIAKLRKQKVKASAVASSRNT